ncbi:MAG: hypothetical protein IPK83_00040 [Planctomycetes bacterium]|nr:hypothetical protein [Planctomycetota bacterium]
MSRLISAIFVLLAIAVHPTNLFGDSTGEPATANENSKASSTGNSRLVITNETNCPVQIFIDDEYIGICESFAIMSIRSERLGRVTLVGRSYCDTWGPVRRTLKAGETSTWKITERERDCPGGSKPSTPGSTIGSAMMPAGSPSHSAHEKKRRMS